MNFTVLIFPQITYYINCVDYFCKVLRNSMLLASSNIFSCDADFIIILNFYHQNQIKGEANNKWKGIFLVFSSKIDFTYSLSNLLSYLVSSVKWTYFHNFSLIHNQILKSFLLTTSSGHARKQYGKARGI